MLSQARRVQELVRTQRHRSTLRQVREQGEGVLLRLARSVAATLITRWQRAEQLTDALQAPLYATLTDRQRSEFAQSVNALTDTLTP